MATWKRFFTNAPVGSQSPFSNVFGQNQGSSAANSSFQSFLPEVYAGAPNRIERYAQYEQMDMDPIIYAALNTIAEFCCQENDYTGLPFNISFKSDDATETEKETLEDALNRWCYVNDFKVRVFHIFRKTIMYGDCFFVRDPETYEFMYVDPKNVDKVVVDELKGKDPESYFIRDLDLNIQAKTLTTQKSGAGYFVPAGLPMPGNPNYPGQNVTSPTSNSRFTNAQNVTEVKNEHMIHISLNTGLELFWPFGTSILEPIFKVHKQKELLEDSMVIYRVQRAPERRVFYIDTGTLPSHKAMAFVERVKNEIQQRRIPSRTGGGSSIMDASYNPLSILEDYFFPVGENGRGSRVELLPGGAELGQINDLLYFTNQMVRGLGVPSSYLPTGPEDSSASFNDGKLGSAFIQELRFSKFCKRIQNILIKYFDYEFKLFLKKSGIVIEASEFELTMEEPESFSEYRTIEKDSSHFNILSQALQNPVFSKRFALKRYGGLSETEILENEQLWREENKKKLKGTKAAGMEEDGDLGVSLRNVGVSPPNASPEELGGEAPDAENMGDMADEGNLGGPGSSTGQQAGGENPGGPQSGIIGGPQGIPTRGQ